MLVVAGIGAGTMLAALAAYLAFGGKPSPVVAPTNSAMMAATGPRTLYVTRGTAPAPEATFPSLAAALKKTAPGDTIQLLDDPHEEPPVRINAASAGKFKGVTIESGIPGKMVVVRHAAAVVSGKHGLLELNGTDGLVIRNLTFDAGGRSDYCLMLSGVVDGLLIENVTFKSATTANVLIDKAIAAPDRRARFDRVLFRVDQGNCDGVQFLSDARTPISNFSIENCRFLGKGWNALHLRGPARNIEFYGNRVYHFDNGIHLQGPEHSCQVKIIGNTFLNLGTTGLWTNGHPPENPPSEVVLERNYFAKTKEILRGPGNKVPGLKAAGNARDKATSGGAGGLDPKAVEVSGTIPSPESDDDSRFLRLDERSPLRSFGPNKLKIGAQ